MSESVKSAVADLQKAITDDDEAMGVRALGTLLCLALGSLERIADALEHIAPIRS